MPSSSATWFGGQNGALLRPVRMLSSLILWLVALGGQAEAQSSARGLVSIEIPPIVHMDVVRVDPPLPDSRSGSYVQSVELEVSANVEWVLHARTAQDVPPGLEWTAEAGSSRSEGQLHPHVLVGNQQLRLASGDSGGSQRVRIVYRWRDEDGAADPPNFRYLVEPMLAVRTE